MSGGVGHAGGGKAVVIRSGALGDVLVARGIIHFLKHVVANIAVTLVAPGERGRFLCRPGWADVIYDWERAAFAWLFSRECSEPPELLRTIFTDADAVFAFIDTSASENTGCLRERLSLLAPCALLLIEPARPEPTVREYIGDWLVGKVRNFCAANHFFAVEGSFARAAESVFTRVSIEAPAPEGLEAGSYLVMHPGSGSSKKNWPLENFQALARLLLSAKGVSGAPLFRRVVVTSGEADGALGERFAAGVSGAIHMTGLSLEELSALLASARLYVGNDSGISHLAGAVCDVAGKYPDEAVIFGPSDASVWGPPGAMLFRGGRGFGEVTVEQVFTRISKGLS